MITIINEQRAYDIPTRYVQKAAQKMLESIGFGHFSCTIFVCGTQKIQQLNNEFRKKNAATDVLSFPAFDAPQPDMDVHPSERHLGEIVLCPLIVDRRRHSWNHSMPEHLIFLIAHSIAHLIGHDHETDEEHAKMAEVEEVLLRAARKVNP
jgi:probable rRNA maturation factor